jgi:hypothetical protein
MKYRKVTEAYGTSSLDLSYASSTITLPQECGRVVTGNYNHCMLLCAVYSRPESTDLVVI